MRRGDTRGDTTLECCITSSPKMAQGVIQHSAKNARSDTTLASVVSLLGLVFCVRYASLIGTAKQQFIDQVEEIRIAAGVEGLLDQFF